VIISLDFTQIFPGLHNLSLFVFGGLQNEIDMVILRWKKKLLKY
jgi:hypothetical protein